MPFCIYINMSLIKRFLTPSKNNFFLFGARGTGKSTWLHQTFPEALFIDLLEDEIEMTLKSYPGRLTEIISTSQKNQIIIDEIQKIPSLLDTIHLLIEKNKNLQFILTGSSIRTLREKTSFIKNYKLIQLSY